MKRVLLQYKVKPDHAELTRAVFEQLDWEAPPVSTEKSRLM